MTIHTDGGRKRHETALRHHFMQCDVRCYPNLVCAQQQPATQPSTPLQHQRQQTGQVAVEFIDKQQPSNWMTSALIGRSVMNSAGEILGDIEDIIIDEQGQVVAVVIGVGGFLGIGEKGKYRCTMIFIRSVAEPNIFGTNAQPPVRKV
jgi:sporulation protein YlmC with PRC-barrel domain